MSDRTGPRKKAIWSLLRRHHLSSFSKGSVHLNYSNFFSGGGFKPEKYFMHNDIRNTTEIKPASPEKRRELM